MIRVFDVFCLWMYTMVDDMWQQIGPFFKRPGPHRRQDCLSSCFDGALVASTWIKLMQDDWQVNLASSPHGEEVVRLIHGCVEAV